MTVIKYSTTLIPPNDRKARRPKRGRGVSPLATADKPTDRVARRVCVCVCSVQLAADTPLETRSAD
jgi:hypothetical protein